MPTINRFPAGRRADVQEFNQFSQDLVALVEDTRRTALDRIAYIERVQAMAAVQAGFPPIYWTSTNVNPIYFADQYISGNAQHDSRYGQVIQPITSWIPRERSSFLISRPVEVGGPKIWQDVSNQELPYGITFDAAPGTYNDVYVQSLLSTTRVCNALVWEPYPSWLYELISVTLMTTSGDVPMDLTYCDTAHHGPQRFFFADTECYGVEIKMKAFPSFDGNKIVVGAFNLELARVMTQPGATFTFQVSTATLTTGVAQGEGSLTSTIVNPGKIQVVLRTPPDGPTSVVRQFAWT